MVLSLRVAVQQANAIEAVDDIRFLASLEGETLTLTQGELTLAGPAPGDFSGTTTIDGDFNNDGTRVTIDGNEQVSVFDVADRAYVSLDDLIIAHGYSRETAGNTNIGGDCRIEFVCCEITNCFSYDYAVGGGGIFAGPNWYVSIDKSQITTNSTKYLGDGISYRPLILYLKCPSIICHDIA
jgi:hypothetical protein